MSTFDRLARMDRRWIFLIMAIAVSVPFVVRIGLEIVVTPEVQSFADAIAAVPEGEPVYLAADLDPGSKAELLPMMRAAVHQCCQRRLKIVGASLWPAAPPLLEQVLNEVAVAEYGYEYGKDFVNLGFKEGREAVMVMAAQDLRAAYPTDYYGTPTSDIPVLEGITGLEDTRILISISAGYPGTKEWVQQVRSRYTIAMVSGCTAVSAPEYYPYLQSGQLSGLLGGLAGAAEYEVAIGLPGTAARAMDGQSLGHVAVILFIVAGNVIYLASRRQGGGAHG